MRLLLLIVGLLAALSLPGVRAARAEADLVPPAAELFAWRSNASAPARGQAASCAATSEATLRVAEARRQAALAQIAELMKGGAGEGQPLNGRGYAYPVNRDPLRELRMVEMEAQRQRAQRAGER
jgi:hypothetical protein